MLELSGVPISPRNIGSLLVKFDHGINRLEFLATDAFEYPTTDLINEHGNLSDSGTHSQRRWGVDSMKSVRGWWMIRIYNIVGSRLWVSGTRQNRERYKWARAFENWIRRSKEKGHKELIFNCSGVRSYGKEWHAKVLRICQCCTEKYSAVFSHEQQHCWQIRE